MSASWKSSLCIQIMSLPHHLKRLPYLKAIHYCPLKLTLNAGNMVVVGNTHLLFNPRRGDIKLVQLQMLLAEMDRMAYCDKVDHNCHGTILCGDMNMEPHCPIFNFLSKGFLTYEGLLVKTMSGQKEARNRGREIYLGQFLLPDEVGITDKCQFFDDVKNKLDAWAVKKRAWWQRKLEKGVGKGKDENDEDCVIVHDKDEGHMEEGEVSDGERQEEELMDKREDSSGNGASNEQSQPSTSKEKDRYNVEDVIERRYSSELDSGSGTLRHLLKLQSVYQHLRHDRKGQIYEDDWETTTHHGRANCAVDFIFYSYQKNAKKHLHKLRLFARLELPTCREMDERGSLPNQHVSSDHVILMAKFAMKIK